jgi:hypothetical protein
MREANSPMSAHGTPSSEPLALKDIPGIKYWKGGRFLEKIVVKVSSGEVGVS